MIEPVLWILLHDLDRTGVPVALLRMLAWHRDHPAARIHVVVGCDGPLAAAIAASGATVTALAPARGRSAAGTVAAGLAERGHTAAARAVAARAAQRRTRHLPRPDVVLLHGSGAWGPWTDLAPAVAPSVRRVLHLHELAAALDRSVPSSAQVALVGEADAVLAVDASTAALAARLGGRDDVEVVPGVTDHVASAPPTAARTRLVLGMGAAGWRKGTDRFVAVAHHLARERPGVSCAWVGDELRDGWRFAVDATVPVRWDGVRTDPWTDVPSGAVLVIPSREDPLPLVALEAGGRGVPVVASPTGGLPELLGDDRGLVVDGFDLTALAAAVVTTVDHPDEARARAERLWDHVRRHHVAEAVGPRWLAAVLGG